MNKRRCLIFIIMLMILAALQFTLEKDSADFKNAGDMEKYSAKVGFVAQDCDPAFWKVSNPVNRRI